MTVGGVMGVASNAGLSSCLWDGCVHSHVLFIAFLFKNVMLYVFFFYYYITV